jgi:hypothetical protein
MTPNPVTFLQHLQTLGYHPRSDKHSNALAEAIMGDLLKYCPKIASKAAAGQLVYDLNFTITVGTADWNIDLVIGSAPLGMKAPEPNVPIVKTPPALVQIAIEIKSVMTEHRKAVKNRKRDFDAHHAHVHQYNPHAIAGGIFILNASAKFKSPLRPSETLHKNPDKLVLHCLDEFRGISSSGGVIGGVGLDAKAVVVVNCDNIDHPGTCYLTTKPAPVVGDPIHYDAFIQNICDLYTARFP